MGLIASKTATQSQKRFLTKRQSGLESAQSGLGISSKLRNVEYHLISPLDTPATGPKHAGEDPRTLPHSLGLVSSKLRSPRKKRFSTKRQSGLESDGQISSISSFRRISSKLRNVEYQLILPLYTPARGPKLAGRVLGPSPAYLGLVSSKLRSPCKKRFSTKRQSGLQSDGQISSISSNFVEIAKC